jgi:hypothetical protein
MNDRQDSVSPTGSTPRPPFALRRSLAEGATALALLACAVGLVLVERGAPFSSPESTVSELSEALRSANIDRLLDEGALGAASMIQREIESRGEAEYQRVMVLIERTAMDGKAEYARRLDRQRILNEKARKAGESAFAGLPEDEQYRVWVGKTRGEWLYERATASLSDEHRRRLGVRDVLTDPAAFERRARELGTAALSDTDRSIVARADADPALAADPYVKPYVDRRDQEGRRLLDEAVAAYRAAEARVGPVPPSTPDQRSRQAAREQELGRAVLAPEEVAFLDGFVPVDEANLAAQTVEIGKSLLSAADRTRLGDWTTDRLRTERKSFVLGEGRRLLREFLVGQIAGCRPAIDSVTYEGWAPASLVRSWHATVRVFWPRAGEGKLVVLRDGAALQVGLNDPVPAELLAEGHKDDVLTWRSARGSAALPAGLRIGSSVCEAFLGDALSLYFRGGDWWIAWPPTPAPTSPAMPPWVAGGRLAPVPSGDSGVRRAAASSAAAEGERP